VLYAGTIFTRRRVPDLIAAFAQVARELPDARLVIAGDNRSWPRQDLAATVAAHGLARQVQVLDFVSDATLDTLFSRASVFAFLSEYEGFGLTPLEALASGVPCVVLDTQVAHEIYGDAVAYAPAGDLAQTADVIRRLLTSRAAGEALLGRAPAILSRYSWARAADQTLAVLDAAVER
jgi:glycosyltransferase involved in cell wall biosynthesis